MSNFDFQFIVLAVIVLAISIWFSFRKKPFRRVSRRRRAGTLLEPTPVIGGDGSEGIGGFFAGGDHHHDGDAGGDSGGSDGGDGGD